MMSLPLTWSSLSCRGSRAGISAAARRTGTGWGMRGRTRTRPTPPGAAVPTASNPIRKPRISSGGSFVRRLAGHSVARIARALNEAGVPCPSAADPGRNTHRTGAGWTLGTVTTISAWSNGKPAYRCRHGRSSAMASDPARPKNTYVREDKIVPHLPAVHLLLTSTAARARRRTRAGADIRDVASPQDVIGYLREHEIALTWDPAAAALQARATETAKTVTVKAS